MGSKVLVYVHPSPNKRHDETVVMVHHLLGNHRTTLRHRRWLAAIGYDTVSFDLVLGSNNWRSALSPLAWRATAGIFLMWQEQITQVLDQVPGPKIIYAFSGPCLSALIAGADRSDIKKVICDGGPFAQMHENTITLVDHLFNIKNKTVAKALVFLAGQLWGVESLNVLHQKLAVWDSRLPILSIRGSHDPIVPEPTIDLIFDQHPHLAITKFSIPGGKHLDGLKNFPLAYKKKVETFLAIDPKPR